MQVEPVARPNALALRVAQEREAAMTKRFAMRRSTLANDAQSHLRRLQKWAVLVAAETLVVTHQ